MTTDSTGFSARVLHTTIVTERGAAAAVVKHDTADLIGREVTFYQHFSAPVRPWVPSLLDSRVDEDSGTGYLVLEDVDPAAQLDVLSGCSEDQSHAIVTALAGLHAAYWHNRDRPSSTDLPPWRGRLIAPERWIDRVTVAQDRFPDVLTSDLTPRLRSLQGDIEAALQRLDETPNTIIHGDVHLDNAMWRPDGTIVLLDWATASVGPGAVDIAGCLVGGLVDAPGDGRTDRLLDTYRRALRDHDIALDTDAITSAILVMTQGLIGWAGSPGLNPGTRQWAVCRKQVQHACSWLTD